MWCAACREYPQQGVRQSWVDGNSCLRLSTVKDHTKCGLHAKSLALWNSAGASSSVVGALPSPVQSCIRGLFAAVYRIAERDGAFNDLPGDAELVTLTGGSITPSYQGQTASVTILHAIAAPYRADEGAAIMASQFFGLTSDSCTDRGARKEELLYTRTVRNGVVTTSYLGCEYLKSGDAGAIVASYKRALLRAGAPVEEWVARLFWYCVDGADVMQCANTGVLGRLRSLQTELLGFSVVVPFHANCHRADLAFRDAMAAGNYGFLDIVADGMQAIALHWNHAPARLGVLRTMCDALRTTLLKFGVLRQRRWAAFAATAVRSLIRTYPAMVCALFALRPATRDDREHPEALLSQNQEHGAAAGQVSQGLFTHCPPPPQKNQYLSVSRLVAELACNA